MARASTAWRTTGELEESERARLPPGLEEALISATPEDAFLEALKHYQPEPVALLPEAPYHGGLVMGIVAKLSNKHLMMLNTFRVWYRVPGKHRRRRVVVEREYMSARKLATLRLLPIATDLEDCLKFATATT